MDEWFATTDVCISLLVPQASYSLCAINLEGLALCQSHFNHAFQGFQNR